MNIIDIGVSSVSLSLLVLGVTQFIKEMFGLTGNKVKVTAVLVGIAFYLIYQATILFPEYTQYIYAIIGALVYAMAAGGYYDLAMKAKS